MLLQAVPCSTCPNRLDPSGAEDTASRHHVLPTPENPSTSTPVTSSPAPGKSPRLWLGWTWDLGLSSLPIWPPRDAPLAVL